MRPLPQPLSTDEIDAYLANPSAMTTFVDADLEEVDLAFGDPETDASTASEGLAQDAAPTESAPKDSAPPAATQDFWQRIVASGKGLLQSIKEAVRPANAVDAGVAESELALSVQGPLVSRDASGKYSSALLLDSALKYHETYKAQLYGSGLLYGLNKPPAPPAFAQMASAEGYVNASGDAMSFVAADYEDASAFYDSLRNMTLQRDFTAIAQSTQAAALMNAAMVRALVKSRPLLTAQPQYVASLSGVGPQLKVEFVSENGEPLKDMTLTVGHASLFGVGAEVKRFVSRQFASAVQKETSAVCNELAALLPEGAAIGQALSSSLRQSLTMRRFESSGMAFCRKYDIIEYDKAFISGLDRTALRNLARHSAGAGDARSYFIHCDPQVQADLAKGEADGALCWRHYSERTLKLLRLAGGSLPRAGLNGVDINKLNSSFIGAVADSVEPQAQAMLQAGSPRSFQRLLHGSSRWSGGLSLVERLADVAEPSQGQERVVAAGHRLGKALNLLASGFGDERKPSKALPWQGVFSIPVLGSALTLPEEDESVRAAAALFGVCNRLRSSGKVSATAALNVIESLELEALRDLPASRPVDALLNLIQSPDYLASGHLSRRTSRSAGLAANASVAARRSFLESLRRVLGGAPSFMTTIADDVAKQTAAPAAVRWTVVGVVPGELDGDMHNHTDGPQLLLRAEAQSPSVADSAKWKADPSFKPMLLSLPLEASMLNENVRVRDDELTPSSPARSWSDGVYLAGVRLAQDKRRALGTDSQWLLSRVGTSMEWTSEAAKALSRPTKGKAARPAGRMARKSDAPSWATSLYIPLAANAKDWDARALRRFERLGSVSFHASGYSGAMLTQHSGALGRTLDALLKARIFAPGRLADACGIIPGLGSYRDAAPATSLPAEPAGRPLPKADVLRLARQALLLNRPDSLERLVAGARDPLVRTAAGTSVLDLALEFSGEAAGRHVLKALNHRLSQPASGVIAERAREYVQASMGKLVERHPGLLPLAAEFDINLCESARQAWESLHGTLKLPELQACYSALAMRSVMREHEAAVQRAPDAGAGPDGQATPERASDASNDDQVEAPVSRRRRMSL